MGAAALNLTSSGMQIMRRGGGRYGGGARTENWPAAGLNEKKDWGEQ